MPHSELQPSKQCKLISVSKRDASSLANRRLNSNINRSAQPFASHDKFTMFQYVSPSDEHKLSAINNEKTEI
jgi:hypothetical protein